jgi:cytochrome c peroxidase
MSPCHHGLPLAVLVTIAGILVSAGCGPPIASAPPAADAVPATSAIVPTAPEPEPERVALGDPALLAGLPGTGPLPLPTLRAWLDDPASHRALDLVPPAWLRPGAGQMKDLSGRLPTRAKIELGRQLFFDPRLSADGSMACATCHDPAHGFTVGRAVVAGLGGETGTRNPPTLLNRIMLAVGDDRQMWDGAATSVEDALLHTLTDPREMAADPQGILARLGAIDGYRLQFERIYGELSLVAIGDALGLFVRCLVTGDAPYDHEVRWRAYRDLPADLLEDDAALAARHEAARLAAAEAPLPDAALRGERLFFGERAWCSACHNGVNFTDESFHTIGVGLDAPEPDLGRWLVTGRDEDWAAFKTPTIRGAVHTAPYMHDGSLATLLDVVEWYAHEGRANRNLDYRFRRIPGGILTIDDKHDLVAFIEACGGPLPVVETGRLPEDRPTARATADTAPSGT